MHNTTSNTGILDAFLQQKTDEEVLLLFYGKMNREVREHLMAALKVNLNNSASVPAAFRKGAFSIADECITNIYEYYFASGIESSMTGVSVCVKNKVVEFIFSNTVQKKDRNLLEKNLREIYQLPSEDLDKNYADKLKRSLDANAGKAGLGLIIVAQRALGNFDFYFEEQFDGNFLFHFKITLDLV